MSIQSLDRAFDILELIGSHSSPVPLKTIAEKLDLSVSTVHNLIRTMVNRGYIQHVGARGGFMLGYELVELASLFPSQLHVIDLVKPYVLELYERTAQESTYFSILRKDVVTPEIYFPSSYSLNVTMGVTTLDKLYCSAQGKVFMAYMKEAQYKKYMQTQEFQRLGPNTITDEAELRKELSRVREQGYGLNNEETEAGASGIAAPLINPNGHMLGVFAIGLPTIRMKEKRELLIQAILDITREAADKLFADFERTTTG